MCNNADSPTGPSATVLPYPLASLAKPTAAPPPNSQVSPQVIPPALLPLDQYRLQLYNYAMAERLRFSQLHHYPGPVPLCPAYPGPYGPRLALSMSLFHHRVLQPEEPKPQHSYIGLIAMAILSSPDSKLVLSDIYQHILDNYPYFRSRGPGWRNSIRHNLSLNDCFIKAGRSANGKGHYWAVHPANVDDFRKGDFRRRKAQRKVRKHMGLAVDDEGNDSPSPPPLSVSPPPGLPSLPPFWPPTPTAVFAPLPGIARKRQFDVASLLAPDEAGDEDNAEEDIDVVASDQEEKEISMENSEKDSASNRFLVEPTANSPQGLQYPLLGSWGMFPGLTLDQALVGRYYEQLAASQPLRRGPPLSSPNNIHANDLTNNSDL
ncbi:forkhead domain 102C [Arctopsyche grandis]|uniref:forkhead domain 102C n=1 Tax=Arctopsyche grandis TaxID=121162 RepID=UPI00406D8C56